MYNRFSILVAGKAGDGVKKVARVIGQTLSEMGRFVFQLDDYQSLIKGGLNYSIVSSDITKINSHYADIDLMIVFDDRNLKLHQCLLKSDGVLIYNEDESQNDFGIGLPLTTWMKASYKHPQNVSICAITAFASLIGLEYSELTQIINKRYKINQSENAFYAEKVYQSLKDYKARFELQKSNRNQQYLTGNQAIALGGYAAGLDVYYAYPMTPSSTILHYYAKHQEKFGIQAIHVENEIAAPMMAAGSIFAGAKAAIGSASGGFALMQEAYSFAGMAEIPLLCFVSSRPGPATGVSTYTAQEDLQMILNQGHGEFPRVIASPPTIEDAFLLASQLMNIAWQFQTPTILLTEKNLSESSMTTNLPLDEIEDEFIVPSSSENYKRYKITESGVSPLLFPPSKETIKWNSHEHLESGLRTDQPLPIVEMKHKRKKKEAGIIQYLKNKKKVQRVGQGDTKIITYGSTFLVVLEAVKQLDEKIEIIAPIYLTPFPVEDLEDLKEKKIIIVEHSLDEQFTSFIEKSIPIKTHKTIKRYDGRPFEPTELARQIQEVL